MPYPPTSAGADTSARFMSNARRCQGDAPPISYNSSIPRHLQQGSNNMVLPFEASQETSGGRRASIDEPLRLIKRHYSALQTFQLNTTTEDRNVKRKLTRIGATMSSVEQDVPASNVKPRLHRGGVKSLVPRMKEMKENASGVEKKTNELRTRVGSLGRKIGKLETRTSRLETGVPRIVDGIWGLEVRMTRVKRGLAMLRTR